MYRGVTLLGVCVFVCDDLCCFKVIIHYDVPISIEKK